MTRPFEPHVVRTLQRALRTLRNPAYRSLVSHPVERAKEATRALYEQYDVNGQPLQHEMAPDKAPTPEERQALRKVLEDGVDHADSAIAEAAYKALAWLARLEAEST